MPSLKKDVSQEELDKAVEVRSRRVLERFGQVATSNVKNPKLLLVLEDVKKYWNDVRTRAFFRPALTSFSCEAVGGEPEAAEDVALIFTLAASGIGIHDDILDRSPHKHLRKTILGLHGVNSALLVGDLLIVKAWTTFHEMIRKGHQLARIADIFEVYGNLSVEICEAEFMETMCRRKLDTDLNYYTTVLWKAMAETEACARIGAIIGNGQTNEVEALAEFGRRLGFMSRLADEIEDCLNLRGDFLHRIEYESVPLPLLYAAHSSTEKYERIKAIVEKSPTPSDAEELLKICFETEAFEYIHKISKKNEKEATRNLRSLRHTNALNLLSSMLNSSCDRIAELCI